MSHNTNVALPINKGQRKKIRIDGFADTCIWAIDSLPFLMPNQTLVNLLSLVNLLIAHKKC